MNLLFQYFLKVCLFLFGVVFLLGLYQQFGPDGSAYKVQDKLSREINEGMKRSEKLILNNRANIMWDYVCPASYEFKGIDVADGLEIASGMLKKVDFTDFLVANEYYNEFSGNQYGLVFISLQLKMVVAIQINDIGLLNSLSSPCVAGANAVLLSGTPREYTGYTKAFRLIDIPISQSYSKDK